MNVRWYRIPGGSWDIFVVVGGGVEEIGRGGFGDRFVLWVSEGVPTQVGSYFCCGTGGKHRAPIILAPD